MTPTMTRKPLEHRLPQFADISIDALKARRDSLIQVVEPLVGPASLAMALLTACLRLGNSSHQSLSPLQSVHHLSSSVPHCLETNSGELSWALGRAARRGPPKMPGCCVLPAAQDHEGLVAGFDSDLISAARKLGLKAAE